MYEPRRASLSRPFKQRQARPVQGLLGVPTKWGQVGWTSLVPVGFFCTPPRVVPRIFTYLKKILRYPKTKTRFWVNAQCSHLITRKPLNVRMGKGKGAKVRHYSKGWGRAPLAAFSYLRDGLQRKVRRFATIRVGRPVLVLAPPGGAGALPLWARQWRTQTSLLRERAREIKSLLTFIRRPRAKFFFGRLFRVAWRRARLRWRARWPLLPARGGALRGRRARLGSGLRDGSLLWAGVASLAGGVRRSPRRQDVRQRRQARGRRWLASLAAALRGDPRA